jgi:hypothetical protein
MGFFPLEFSIKVFENKKAAFDKCPGMAHSDQELIERASA